MNIPVDIHTHRLPQVPGTAIANCYPETFSPQSGGWYSVGIHPWHIGRSGGEHSGAEGAVASRVCGLEELVRHPPSACRGRSRAGQAGRCSDGFAGGSVQVPGMFGRGSGKAAGDSSGEGG